jgi:iron complex outermembrane receptor protein
VQLKRNLLSVALASATLILANSAQAQSTTAATDTATPDTSSPATTDAKADAKKKPDAAAPAADLGSVQAVGIRRAIADAIETKQNSTSIVESVSAEDIGKLPDSSIAESIARLPGLTAQRERGRATEISIRGLSGDFAGTTLNGREQTTTGENRGVEFDQFPSEVLGSVVVYKTPDASLVGQGLSGTIDLRTVRPLDFQERVLSGNFRGDQNSGNGQKTYGNRYSFAYIDQFMDRTLGIAIGYAHLDSPNPGFQNESWGYADGPNGTKVSGGGKIYKFDDNGQRDGLMMTLQFKPSDFYESNLDIFYSKFKKTEVKTGVEYGTQWGGATLQPGYVVNGNGTITDSHWTNVKPVVRMDSNPSDDHLHSIGWNNKWHFNDHWSLNADLSTSKTSHKFRFLELYAGLKANGGLTTLEQKLNDAGSYLDLTWGSDFSNPNNLELIDRGGWGQDGYVKDFEITDKLNAFRVDLTRNFDSGIFSSVAFGVNRTDRTKTKSSIEHKLCLVACAGGDSAPFPGTSGAFGVPGSGIDNLAFFDADALLATGLYHFIGNPNKDITNKNWTVDEKLDTFYTQFNIDTDVDNMPLRGNVGFQYVRADQSSDARSTYSGNPDGTPFHEGTSYSNFLPSLNLSLEVTDQQYIRFGAGKQMARPRMLDMRASFDVSITTSGTCGGLTAPVWCASGGNPFLRPWLANYLDLSWEKYFTTDAGNRGYVSAAYFYKQLTSYIYNRDTTFDFAGLPLPPQVGNQVYPTSTVGSINQPVNGQGGFISGTELTVSVPFDLLWSALNGFGVQASYSDTTTNIHPFGPGSSTPLPGYSKYVSNITVYYENHGFSVRFSQRKRSAFLGEFRGGATPGADLQYTNVNAETVEDAQVNYNFSSGRLAGLSLYLQVSNIGDTPFRTSDGTDSANRPVAYFAYGRTTLLGFSYKF